MDEALSKLLVKQTVLGQKIDKTIINGKKTNLERRTVGFFENKISELKKLWHEFDKVDNQINELILSEKLRCTDEYITLDKYSEFDIKYNEYIGELTDGIRQKTKQTGEGTGSPPPPPPPPNSNNSAAPHLPKITLPKFGGNYDAWRSFHDLFVSLIHNNTHLQPVHKLHYLKGCLEGEAERLLKHIPTTADDYDPAWEKLKQRYENKRLLVNTQLKILLNQPKLFNENSKTLKTFLDTTEECLQQLTLLGVDVSSWDTILIYTITQKLPFATLKLWEEEQGDTPTLPKFEELRKFLQTRFRILESVTHTIGHTSVPKQTHQTSKSYHITNNTANCPACSGNHYVLKCQKFLNMDTTKRRQCINTTSRCYNCLSNKHIAKHCTNSNRCKHCNAKHHTLLHGEAGVQKTQTNHTKKATPRATPNPTTTQSQNDDTVAGTSAQSDENFNFFSSKTDNVTLATTLLKTYDRNGASVTLRALVDPGSQSSFITEKVVKRLGLHGKPTKVEICGLNKSQTARATKLVQVELSSCNMNTTKIQVEMLVINKITDTLPSTPGSNKQWAHLKGLDLADPTYWKPGVIDILLGAKTFAEILKGEVKKGPKGAPIAINTILGWIILGNDTSTEATKVDAFTITTKSDDELNNLLKKFWEQEEVYTNRILKPEDEKCEKIYETTHKRLDNGKYMVQLPFINTQGPSLGSSKEQALKRFQYLERKLDANQKLKEQYSKCLNEYLELGHMAEVHDDNTEGYYIPHHAVFKESTTTKLRVVFDASAKTSNGKSLNEQLLIGPTIQPKLFATLLKWRKYKIAMTADIEKMYRQILIDPKHQVYQKILWRDAVTNSIKAYQLKTVTFGTSSAPYLAIRTLQQLAKDEQSRFPLAANATISDFYVDDLLTGADSIDEAKLVQKQFIELLQSGGFNLRKWASNNTKVLEDLAEEDREIKNIFNFDDSETVKTLGIRWLPSSDCFTFTVEAKIEKEVYTKRKILSEVASLYDPLGWIAPVLIIAKLIIQRLWITGCTWDEKVNEQVSQQWLYFKENLSQLTNIRIPRWVGNSNETMNMQIHGFCDASTHAYAGVVYLRVTDKDGVVTAKMLTSKTKVAPIKPTTVPRLELNAAVLLSRLIKQTINDMQLQPMPIFAWSDSTIALQWIKSHPSRWKTYVSNRTVEIQEIVEPTHWRHIPTDQNPADIASRGCRTETLVGNQLWWHGPTWLIQDEPYWPNLSLPLKQTELEVKKNTLRSFIVKVDDAIFSKYSSFSNLTRVMAFLNRFIHNCKNKDNKRIGILTVVEKQLAANKICQIIQLKEFAEDYACLKRGEPVSKKSLLRSLAPFLDAHGIIRVGGRLENANVPYNRKHPILLPRNHHVTKLIINKIHLETLHGGVGIVLNTSRNLYWILNGKKVIAHYINHCNTCIRYRQKTRSQLMGNLPSCRVNVSQAFMHVGVDYAGPIMVKSSTLRSAKICKGYFCVFVCMATKAIHLELVSDLTSIAFLAAFKRFVSRRGLCSDLYSDCGTNFKGAIPMLEKDFKEALREATPILVKYLQEKQVTWHFNPPGTPHFGGIWEAGVKAVKYHLRRVVGKSVFTFEEYATLLTQIEAILNSRPLCKIENDTEDILVLTPGHFLIGRSLNSVPEPNLLKEKIVLGQRWRHIQLLAQQFWDKWSKDYLNKLQQRPKWCTVEQNFQIGDVVLLKEDNIAPAYWPLGKITNTFPGADGLTRVVQIQTKAGTIRRPISKVVKLATEVEQQQEHQ